MLWITYINNGHYSQYVLVLYVRVLLNPYLLLDLSVAPWPVRLQYPDHLFRSEHKAIEAG